MPTLPCCPCDFPAEDLVLTYQFNPFWVPAGDPNPPITITLPYRSATQDWLAVASPGEWQFKCVSSLPNLCLSFLVGLGCCYASGDWILIDYTCNPFRLHYRAPNTSLLDAECACDQDPTGFCGTTNAPPLYLDVWISFPDSYAFYDDIPCHTNTIHVTGCNGLDLVGASIEIRDADDNLVDSGTTDADGMFSPVVAGYPFSVAVSKERFVTTTFPNQALGCCAGVTLEMGGNIADGYHCMSGCVDPVADTLHGTHDVFGSLAFSYDPSGSDGPGWYDVLSYSYPGCFCCSPKTVTVTCHLSPGATYLERWNST